MRQPQLFAEFEPQARVAPGGNRSLHGPVSFPEPDGAAPWSNSAVCMWLTASFMLSTAGRRSSGAAHQAGSVGDEALSVDGRFSTAQKRADRIVLEANKRYWDPERVPKAATPRLRQHVKPQRSRGVGQERRRAGRPGQRGYTWGGDVGGPESACPSC